MHSDSTAIIHVSLLREGAIIPTRATTGSAGFDIYACPDTGDAGIVVWHDPVVIPTGIALQFPPSLDVQIRPRSGLGSRGVMSTLGTIDSDFRGEILVTMYTVGTRPPHIVRHGDRIAQIVVNRRAEVSWEIVGTLKETERGDGGHGSTGD